MASNQREIRVKNLSNNVLGMKFMSRTHEASRREELEKEKQKKLSEAQWVLDSIDRTELKSATQFEQDTSFTSFLPTTSYGRKSYQSFNKEIDKIASEMEKAERVARQVDNEERETVSDREMTERYQGLVGGGVVGGGEGSKKKRKREGGIQQEEEESVRIGKATRFSSLNKLSFMKPPE
ncbi:M-phase phosphoprotein 6 [Rhizophlyctis rosea]|nr:M-phase phosphoprotein 6 [Rhizophlyctis rosea]